MREPVKVLVVDDSALMRKLISQILQCDPAIQVVGTAMDGSFGLRKIEELRPDVVTLDLEMPRMDGIETLRVITRKYKIPVIIVSTHSKEGASSTFQALSLGAFDFVRKPMDAASGHLEEIASELTRKIKMAAATGAPRAIPEVPAYAPKAQKPSFRPRRGPSRVIAIGVSTGGPNALQYVLSQLPGEFTGSILIVQHMPEGFTEMFARHLDESCAIEVREACSGDLLLAGTALVCPGNRHMMVRHTPRGDVVALMNRPPVNGHRPSVDVLFRSVAREVGPQSVALLMTGMGEDGAEGLGEVKAAGGLTIAQSPETCVVDGMPSAAISRGHAVRVVPLDALASTLQTQCVAHATRTMEIQESPAVHSGGGKH
jgi:two-component system, chemotaxis family, protein-glutamate methylesterase/glutaminase